MTDDKKTNFHDGHVASCLCCAFLDMGYEDDLSDVTPGRGYYCECDRGHFDDLPPHQNHRLIVLGLNCSDFVART